MSKVPYENLPSYSEAMSSNPPVDQVPASSGMVHEQMSAMPTAPYPPQQYQPAPTIIMAPPTNTTTVINNTTPQLVLMGGGCPMCHVGVLKERYTCCAWCCAICLFPVGILCCLCMTHKKCDHCGASF